LKESSALLFKTIFEEKLALDISCPINALGFDDQ
jgi:hypothetical protein